MIHVRPTLIVLADELGYRIGEFFADGFRNVSSLCPLLPFIGLLDAERQGTGGWVA